LAALIDFAAVERKATLYYRSAIAFKNVTANLIGNGNRGATGGNLAFKPSSLPNLCKDWLTRTR
jgi:hypothetical protein